jgi:hypothetical protein
MDFRETDCKVEWDELIAFVTGSTTRGLDESTSSTSQSQNNSNNQRFKLF